MAFCRNVAACSYAASNANGPSTRSVASRKRLTLLALLSARIVEVLKSVFVSR